VWKPTQQIFDFFLHLLWSSREIVISVLNLSLLRTPNRMTKNSIQQSS
jgi:hypothetical protein